MDGWGNFFFAEIGAAAALTGLIFVGVSINLSKILAIPRLPNRAFQALFLLVAVLIVSSLLLVPGQSLTVQGVEMLAIGVIACVTMALLDRDARRKAEPEFRRVVMAQAVLNQIAVLPYAIAGILLLIQGDGGLYWLVPAIIFSFLKAILDAWVLLVEINL
jgi:modulator of FtsH protease